MAIKEAPVVEAQSLVEQKEVGESEEQEDRASEPTSWSSQLDGEANQTHSPKNRKCSRKLSSEDEQSCPKSALQTNPGIHKHKQIVEKSTFTLTGAQAKGTDQEGWEAGLGWNIPGEVFP